MSMQQGFAAPNGGNSAGIRPARVDDVAVIGELHRTALTRALDEAVHGLSNETKAVLAQTDFAAGWQQAVQAPPTPAHHVLVSYAGTQIAGFAALQPAPDRPGHAQIVALIGADKDTYDRLINAVADIARAANAQGLTIWALQSDTLLVQTLSASGFEPTGNKRVYELGDSHASEHMWHVGLGTGD